MNTSPLFPVGSTVHLTQEGVENYKFFWREKKQFKKGNWRLDLTMIVDTYDQDTRTVWVKYRKGLPHDPCERRFHQSYLEHVS
jgi:hypothetical protein